MKYLVEFLGTLVFLFVIIYVNNPLATGAILATVIMIGGHISGGYFNPAVTVMMAAANQLPNREVIPYIIAQIAGGLCALEIKKQL